MTETQTGYAVFALLTIAGWLLTHLAITAATLP